MQKIDARAGHQLVGCTGELHRSGDVAEGMSLRSVRREPDVLSRIAEPKVHYSPESFDLKAEIVEGCKVQPRWADGHHSGIYGSFTYLQRLASGTWVPGSPGFKLLSRERIRNDKCSG